MKRAPKPIRKGRVIFTDTPRPADLPNPIALLEEMGRRRLREAPKGSQ